MNFLAPNPHRNTPTPQLETELGQLHDRIGFLLRQAELARPGTLGEAQTARAIEQCRDRRAAIFNELRRRRGQ